MLKSIYENDSFVYEQRLFEDHGEIFVLDKIRGRSITVPMNPISFEALKKQVVNTFVGINSQVLSIPANQWTQEKIRILEK